MNAEKFLRTKGIGEPTMKAVRLPHKYKNIEFELLPLMEEYAQQQIVSAERRSEQLKAEGREEATEDIRQWLIGMDYEGLAESL